VALKMTNREVDGVSVMELDRHIVLGEPRSSAERSPFCQNTSECSVIPPESMPSAEITSSNWTSRSFRRTHIDENGVNQALGRRLQRRLLSKAQTRAV
jgi:hypothetical protein